MPRGADVGCGVSSEPGAALREWIAQLAGAPAGWDGLADAVAASLVDDTA